MKITSIHSQLVSRPFEAGIDGAFYELLARDVLIIRLGLEDGTEGVCYLTGQHTPAGRDLSIVAAIIHEFLANVLIGRSVFETEANWETMFKVLLRVGHTGAAMRAVSGLDLAQWDAKGKLFNQPVAKLLGGHKQEVRAYITEGFLERFAGMSEEAMFAGLEANIERGFSRIKLRFGGPKIKEQMRLIRRLKSHFGDRLQLMLDANQRLSVGEVVRLIPFLEETEIVWLEEPLPSWDIAGYRKLAGRLPCQIALGENLYTRYAFRPFIEEGLADIVQPDATTIGGITEWIAIAGLASSSGLPCVPHGVAEINIHVVAGSAAGAMVEHFLPGHPFQGIIADLLAHKLEEGPGGTLRVPDRPGLGLCFDQSVEDKYTIRRWSTG